MHRNPILHISLTDILRQEIALPLQHVLHIYTVGHFLSAWRNPKSKMSIEQCFDSPQQARHAAATYAAWLGVPTPASLPAIAAWWPHDEQPAMSA